MDQLFMGNFLGSNELYSDLELSDQSERESSAI